MTLYRPIEIVEMARSPVSSSSAAADSNEACGFALLNGKVSHARRQAAEAVKGLRLMLLQLLDEGVRSEANSVLAQRPVIYGNASASVVQGAASNVPGNFHKLRRPIALGILDKANC